MEWGRVVDAAAFGPARRRRRMRRRLAELDRIDAAERAAGPRISGDERVVHAFDWDPVAGTAPTGRRPVGMVLVVAVALTGGLLWFRSRVSDTVDHLATTLSRGAPPRLPADAALSRLLPAPLSPAGSGAYAFLQQNPRGPAAYDPCRPIHVVVSNEAAPVGSDALVASALERVSRASGLRFIVDGPTSELASVERPAVNPTLYGQRWSPVLLAWTTPERIPRLEGDVAGVGGSSAMPTSTGRLLNVTGIVYLDGPTARDLVRRPGGSAHVEAILLHELGHLVGLGHVDDPTQLMAATSSGQTGFGSGDLRGLFELGSRPCTREF